MLDRARHVATVAPEHEQAARRKIAQQLEIAQRYHGWYGAGMLFVREMHRFLRIAGQSIVTPVLTTMLWFLVFGVSLGQRIQEVNGVPYLDFLVPGLVLMNVVTNSFFNASFGFFITKIHGSIVDLLVTPLSPLQTIGAYALTSVARGSITGGIIWLIAQLMGAQTLAHPGWTVFFILLSSLSFGLLGLAIAVLARDFEQINFVPSFVLFPLVFLGGVFYSITMLPEPWQTVTRFNPLLYLVNGLRYGMTGVGDVPVWNGALLALGFALCFGGLAYVLFTRGKNLRD